MCHFILNSTFLYQQAYPLYIYIYCVSDVHKRNILLNYKCVKNLRIYNCDVSHIWLIFPSEIPTCSQSDTKILGVSFLNIQEGHVLKSSLVCNVHTINFWSKVKGQVQIFQMHRHTQGSSKCPCFSVATVMSQPCSILGIWGFALSGVWGRFSDTESRYVVQQERSVLCEFWHQ